MTGKLVLDAHALVWYLQGDSRLSASAQAAMDDAGSEMVLPVTALAESCWVVERGKTRVPSVGHLLAAIDADARIRTVPLDRETVERSNSLTAIHEMHDRQIVATAMRLRDAGEPFVLVTKDAVITASNLVPVLW